MITTIRSGLNGQAPRCDHLGLLPAVERGLPECRACLALGETWTDLFGCMTCGWVACSAHARAHYQETDHPVAASIESGSTWRWCYVHGRAI